jgi:hypothetical protein
MVGDYISTSFVAGDAQPFFAVAKPPSGALLDEATYTTGGPASHAAQPLQPAQRAPGATPPSATAEAPAVGVGAR